MAEKKKLELVAATGDLTKDNPFLASLVIEKLPEGVKVEKLNLPPLVPPGQIPIGGIVSGALVKVIKNFTGSTEDSMKKSMVVHLKHETGTEFLFPLTGTIKKSMTSLLDEKGETLLPKYVGKKVWFQRGQDGKAKKYGGKPMFMFDVIVEKV